MAAEQAKDEGTRPGGESGAPHQAIREVLLHWLGGPGKAFAVDDIADSIGEALELVRETRVRWEWPEIPEGWRYCDNQTLTNDGRMFRTATAASRTESPYFHAHQHLEAERFEDERWLTPWVTHSGSSDPRA